MNDSLEKLVKGFDTQSDANFFKSPPALRSNGFETDKFLKENQELKLVISTMSQEMERV